MKKSVRDLFRMQNLGNFPIIDEDATIRDALFAFKRFDSSTVLVMRSQELVGLYSERDFARTSLETKGTLNLDTKVADAMAHKIIYVTVTYKLEECLAVMAKMNISVLPVMENERPIALLRMKHIMETLIEDQEFMIGQLVQYVTSSYNQEPIVTYQAVVKTHTYP